MQGMMVSFGGRMDTLGIEESICGTDEYEQCRNKEDRIFVMGKSSAGVEMGKRERHTGI